VLLFGALLLPVAGGAQGVNRAGVIVAMEDGQVVTACVAFDEPAISGLALLERSGLDLNVQMTGGNAAVCSINGTGCFFPREGCFCRCQGGGPCRYWTYWHLNGGGWQYASTGAASYQVPPGGVDGWAWGEGSVNSGRQPPATSFDKVCPVPAEARTMLVETTPADSRLAVPPGDTPTSPAQSIHPSPSPVPPVAGTAEQRQAARLGSPALRYLLWGGTIAGLLFAIGWTFRRRP